MSFWSGLLQSIGESVTITNLAGEMIDELQRVSNGMWSSVMTRHMAGAYEQFPEHIGTISQTFSEKIGQLEDSDPRFEGLRVVAIAANLAAMVQVNERSKQNRG